MTVLEQLLQERPGGLYALTQVKFAYHSNRIEGGRLTEEQTRLLFEGRELPPGGESLPPDDVTETRNHFALFDHMLATIRQPLTEPLIQSFHRILKSSTADARRGEVPGAYKREENVVGGMETVPPAEVCAAMAHLLRRYAQKERVALEDMLWFHVRLEQIHPFPDGNGRVGRMILFRECLRNGVVPFLLEAEKKAFYYRGLREYRREPGYLTDTCLDAQDRYRIYLRRPARERAGNGGKEKSECPQEHSDWSE